jgi:hypothetical protein
MTAKYPVEVGDSEGIVDAINYVLSGPAGLGQNFDGFSDYKPAYLAGTFRAPFTVPISTNPPPTLYVAPISISNITVPNNPGAIIDVTYTTPQSPVPFGPGDTVRISGATPSFYDDNYRRGVLEVSSTGVLVQYTSEETWPAYVSGGTITKNASDVDVSTDCNGRVTVSGPSDEVFLSAQLNLNFTYDCTIASEWDIIVKIDRYAGFPTTTAGDNEFLFDLDTNGNPIVSEQVTHYSASTSGTSGNTEYIFTTVLDRPSFGYYWYILDIVFSTKNPLLGGLLEQPYGSQLSYTYSGTSATQAVTTDYFNVIPTTLTGIGSGADIDIQLLEGVSGPYTEANTTINLINVAGSDYAVGDTLLVAGTDLGGASPANDLTLTVVSVDPQSYPGDVTPGVFTLGLRSFTAQVIKQ